MLAIIGALGVLAALSPPEIVEVELRQDPPRLEGPRTDLRIENGALVGTLAGDQYNAQVGSDRVTGVGPFGKIDLLVTAHPGELRFDGIWNGQPLHLGVGSDGVRGHAFRMARAGGKEMQSCDLRIDEPKGDVLGGQALCMGRGNPLRFSIRTPVLASLVDEETALLLTAFLAGPPQPAAGR